jgi:hypothetical protein
LICIADWLIMHNRDEYMNVYARVRATVLLKSLQQLKEQQRSSSGGSIQGVPAANSPMAVSFCLFTGRNISYWNIPCTLYLHFIFGKNSDGILLIVFGSHELMEVSSLMSAYFL